MAGKPTSDAGAAPSPTDEPAVETEAERVVLAIAREALRHAGLATRRTHASSLSVNSPAGTITVDTVSATEDGLVRFEGQLKSRATAALVVPPDRIEIAFSIKPVRDLRVAERDIGAAILEGLGATVAARTAAGNEARQRKRERKKAAKRAKKAAKLGTKLDRKADKARPDDASSNKGG